MVFYTMNTIFTFFQLNLILYQFLNVMQANPVAVNKTDSVLAFNKKVSENKDKSKFAYLGLEKFMLDNGSAGGLLTDAEELTADDIRTQEEWGGSCTLKHWDKCKVIKTWFGWYLNVHDFPDGGNWMHYELDCILEPILCMKNGWTINRCHILCMANCNKELLYKYDKWISHEGECKAHG